MTQIGVTSMMILALLSLLLNPVVSWSANHPPIRNPLTQLQASASNNDEKSPSSRRQWIQNIVGSATAMSFSACLPPLPAHAVADLVSTKAVCDTTVSVWEKNGRIVYLLGTAHVSAESAKLASQLVKDTVPTGVFVELDNKRVNGKGDLKKYLDEFPNSRLIIPDINAIGKMELEGGGEGRIVKDFAKPTKKDPVNPFSAAAGAALGKEIGGMYDDIDKNAGIKPGEEFINAINEGAKLGSAIVLGDQDVDVSLRHMAQALLKTDPMILLGGDEELSRTMKQLSGDNTFKEGGDLKDEAYRKEFTDFVEKVKTKENTRVMMTQLKRLSPPLYDALVGERDAYMAAGLNGLNELESIVAVVGIAHADGIEANLQRNGWKAANPSCNKFKVRG